MYIYIDLRSPLQITNIDYHWNAFRKISEVFNFTSMYKINSHLHEIRPKCQQFLLAKLSSSIGSTSKNISSCSSGHNVYAVTTLQEKHHIYIYIYAYTYINITYICIYSDIYIYKYIRPSKLSMKYMNVFYQSDVLKEAAQSIRGAFSVHLLLTRGIWRRKNRLVFYWKYHETSNFWLQVS